MYCLLESKKMSLRFDLPSSASKQQLQLSISHSITRWQLLFPKGLASGYRHRHATRKVCGQLWGLSYLPAHMIEASYRWIVDQNPGRRFRNLLDYFERTWLNGQFDKKFWSVYREPIRTNNSIEGRQFSELNVHRYLPMRIRLGQSNSHFDSW